MAGVRGDENRGPLQTIFFGKNGPQKVSGMGLLTENCKITLLSATALVLQGKGGNEAQEWDKSGQGDSKKLEPWVPNSASPRTHTEPSKQLLGPTWPCRKPHTAFPVSAPPCSGFFPAPKLAKPAIWLLKGTVILTSQHVRAYTVPLDVPTPLGPSRAGNVTSPHRDPGDNRLPGVTSWLPAEQHWTQATWSILIGLVARVILGTLLKTIFVGKKRLWRISVVFLSFCRRLSFTDFNCVVEK